MLASFASRVGRLGGVRSIAIGAGAAAAGCAVAYSRCDAPAHAVMVISPTFYPSLDDTRCQLGLQACRTATALGLPVLLVDASPPQVHAALKETGAIVLPQTAKGRKGAALREAVAHAVERLPDDGIICYQELEKVEMVRLQPQVAEAIRAQGADVCVPRREDGAFHSSYPIEQYHSENFVNLYLDALGKQVGLPSIDWTFGPVAFRCSIAIHFLRFTGELWDAQIVPFVNAARWHGARVISHTVKYEHPLEMKAEEEGASRWSEKRLDQLNFLFRHVADEALKATTPPKGAV